MMMVAGGCALRMSSGTGLLVAQGLTELSGVAVQRRAATMPAALVGAPVPQRVRVQVHVVRESRGV